MEHLLQKMQNFLSRDLTIISRKKYLDRLASSVDTGLITVVTGMRRTGKSLLIVDYLQKIGTKKVFYFSKEFDALSEIESVSDLVPLFELFQKQYYDPEYIVIDEIQDIFEWEKFVRLVYAEKKYKIIITGSNANLLSSELATFLSGRYISIQVFPLDYQEFLNFRTKQSTNETILEYLTYGGLPEISKIPLLRDKESYLSAIADSVLLKDVITRHQIRDTGMIRRILSFFADNIGSLTTLRNISNYFKGQQISFSFPALLNYVSYFQEAFVIQELKRYDIRGKKILEINNKYFFSDTGIRNSVLGKFDGTDIAKMLENSVLLQLCASGYTVFVGKQNELEVDFIAEDMQGNKKYIQVSYVLTEESTWEREIAPLMNLMDAYPRFIITLDPFRRGNYEGIQIIGFEEIGRFF